MNLIYVTQQQPEMYPPKYLHLRVKCLADHLDVSAKFCSVCCVSSVFEKDPSGADSPVSSNHRTRNLLEFSASQESSTAQKIPDDIISEKSNR